MQLKSSSIPGPANMASLDKQVVELTSQVERARNETNTMEAQVKQLQDKLEELEKDKEEREIKMKDQEEWVLQN